VFELLQVAAQELHVPFVGDSASIKKMQFGQEYMCDSA
jgi:hypothetical protein